MRKCQHDCEACERAGVCSLRLRTDGKVDGNLKNADGRSEEIAHDTAEDALAILPGDDRADASGDEHARGSVRRKHAVRDRRGRYESK